MQKKRNGFTIIEIMVVVVILAMVGTFVLPGLFKNVGKARTKIARSRIGLIEGALGQFSIDCGRMPSDEEGLEALVVPPADLEEKWDGQYAKESQIIDPWGNPYIYFHEGSINIGSYDIISYGADGVEDGEGENADIIND